jgi:hypothetical protein
MKFRIILLLLTCGVLSKYDSNAQFQVEKGRELGEIIRIVSSLYEKQYLTFQAQTIIEDSANQTPPPVPPGGGTPLSYSSDTIHGQYRLSDGRYWILLDSVIEYVQGYNYSLAVYHEDSMITVGKPSVQNPVLQLGVLDSSFEQAHVINKTIFEWNDSVTRVFKLEFSPEAPYSGYEIQYNKNTHEISTITYYLKNGYQQSGGSMSTAKITMNIFNYNTTPFSPNYFLEEKFITRNAQGFTTRNAFSGFQIIPTADF